MGRAPHYLRWECWSQLLGGLQIVSRIKSRTGCFQKLRRLVREKAIPVPWWIGLKTKLVTREYATRHRSLGLTQITFTISLLLGIEPSPHEEDALHKENGRVYTSWWAYEEKKSSLWQHIFDKHQRKSLSTILWLKNTKKKRKNEFSFRYLEFEVLGGQPCR